MDTLWIEKIYKSINFIPLAAGESEEKLSKKIENEKSLGSFRCFDESSQSPYSFQTGSPNMGILGISPIEKVQHNFTFHSNKFVKNSIEKDLEVIASQRDESEEENPQIVSKFKRNKTPLHTPTFHQKNEGLATWEDRSQEGIKFVAELNNTDSYQFTVNRLYESSDVDLDKNTDAKDFPNSEIKNPGFFESVDNKEKIENSYLSMQLSDSVLQSSRKNNDAEIIDNFILEQPHLESKIKARAKGKKLKKKIVLDNIKLIMQHPMHNIRSSSVSDLTKKKNKVEDVSLIKSGYFFSHKKQSKSVNKVLDKSLNPQRKEKTPVRLPKINDFKSEFMAKQNPYLSSWTTNTLKNQFSLNMKIQKDQTGVKALLTKCVKKRKKPEKISLK